VFISSLERLSFTPTQRTTGKLTILIFKVRQEPGRQKILIAASIPRSERPTQGVLISLWLFLFAAQPKEFFLDGLKKSEQPSHKCVELRGECVE
jgi:hypothetical protein